MLNTKNECVLMDLVNKFDTILVEDIGYKPDTTRMQQALWVIPMNKNHLKDHSYHDFTSRIVAFAA